MSEKTLNPDSAPARDVRLANCNEHPNGKVSMIVFFLLLLSILAAAAEMPDFSAELSRPFQKICIGLSPTVTDFRELYTATICGIIPSNTEMMWDFRNTGLYHLIVVSGAHLSFLASLIMLIPISSRPTRFGNIKKMVLITALLVYAFASGLNPPIVRALAGYFLFAFQKRRHLGWSNYSVVIISGLVCLTVFPAWWSSLSFLMSWLASLAIILPGRNWQKAAYCYVLLLLPMSQFQWNHPLTIGFNLLLAPVLGFIVLPFSLLPFFIPPTVFLSDGVWWAVTSLVHYTSQVVTSASPLIVFPKWLVWFALFALHLLLYEKLRRIRRAEWKSL